MAYYQVLQQGKVVGYVHGVLGDLLHYYEDSGYEFKEVEVACMVSTDNLLHAIVKDDKIVGYVCGSTQALQRIYQPPHNNLPGLEAYTQMKVVPLEVAVISEEEVTTYKMKIEEIYQERARQIEEVKKKRIVIPRG